MQILYEDNDVLVVSKPAGLLTQAPLGIDSLEVRIKRLLRERGQQPGEIYLGVPHRLDRPASGVIVFAKNLKAARKISRQFEARFVKKTYWALVEGEVTPAEGTWTDSLKKVYGQPRAEVVEASDREGRVAVMRYRVRGQRSEFQAQHSKWTFTLLEIELKTGRTHQIRVQCASRGHPLLGDELYGSRVPFGPWRDDERERVIALHARMLTFRHPTTREDVTFIAPLPEFWQASWVDAAG